MLTVFLRGLSQPHRSPGGYSPSHTSVDALTVVSSELYWFDTWCLAEVATLPEAALLSKLLVDSGLVLSAAVEGWSLGSCLLCMKRPTLLY